MHTTALYINKSSRTKKFESNSSFCLEQIFFFIFAVSAFTFFLRLELSCIHTQVMNLSLTFLPLYNKAWANAILLHRIMSQCPMIQLMFMNKFYKLDNDWKLDGIRYFFLYLYLCPIILFIIRIYLYPLQCVQIYLRLLTRVQEIFLVHWNALSYLHKDEWSRDEWFRAKFLLDPLQISIST